jgi:hypothetical protein
MKEKEPDRRGNLSWKSLKAIPYYNVSQKTSDGHCYLFKQ